MFQNPCKQKTSNAQFSLSNVTKRNTRCFRFVSNHKAFDARGSYCEFTFTGYTALCDAKKTIMLHCAWGMMVQQRKLTLLQQQHKPCHEGSSTLAFFYRARQAGVLGLERLSYVRTLPYSMAKWTLLLPLQNFLETVTRLSSSSFVLMAQRLDRTSSVLKCASSRCSNPFTTYEKEILRSTKTTVTELLINRVCQLTLSNHNNILNHR